MVSTENWTFDHRPGYFGKRRDEKIAYYDRQFGEGNWRLVWRVGEETYDFVSACKNFYEESYYRYLKDRPADVDFICSYGECIDNAPTNVQSGLDYNKQESASTHIQDIAIRNVIARLGRRFDGPKSKILVIRGPDSEGFCFNPGNVPFHDQALIQVPQMSPSWAYDDSVESFWQSNKWLQRRA